jgi:subfamily B ATP-binding cassette protein HlyB/CyaB
MAGLFKHMMRLPMSFFTSRKTGDTVSRIKELEVVRNFFSGPAVTSIIDFPFTLIFIMVMYWFSPLLTFVVVLSVVSLLLLYGVMGSRIRRRIREKSQTNSDNQSFLVEGISSVEMIKSLSVEPQLQRKWEEQVVQSSNASVETEQLNHQLSQMADSSIN